MAKARLRQAIQNLEKEIAELEARESEINALLIQPETYSAADANEKVKELNLELGRLHDRLPAAYQEWEDAAATLEEG